MLHLLAAIVKIPIPDSNVFLKSAGELILLGAIPHPKASEFFVIDPWRAGNRSSCF